MKYWKAGPGVRDPSWWRYFIIYHHRNWSSTGGYKGLWSPNAGCNVRLSCDPISCRHMSLSMVSSLGTVVNLTPNLQLLVLTLWIYSSNTKNIFTLHIRHFPLQIHQLKKWHNDWEKSAGFFLWLLSHVFEREREIVEGFALNYDSSYTVSCLVWRSPGRRKSWDKKSLRSVKNRKSSPIVLCNVDKSPQKSDTSAQAFCLSHWFTNLMAVVTGLRSPNVRILFDLRPFKSLMPVN